MRYRQLSSTGDYTVGKPFLANTPDTVAQAVLTVLELIQGEWFLDTTAGVPYPTEVLGYGTKSTYDDAIRTAILNTEGVTEIVTYSSTFNATSRALSITATLATLYGTTTITTVV